MAVELETYRISQMRLQFSLLSTESNNEVVK